MLLFYFFTKKSASSTLHTRPESKHKVTTRVIPRESHHSYNVPANFELHGAANAIDENIADIKFEKTRIL